MCSTARRLKKVYKFDVYAGFECGSVGNGKQCSLIWSYVEEREWSCLVKGV